jgi:hypothetical protein
VVAGFIVGLTKDNNLTEIEACVANVETEAPDMVSELKLGIADFKHGGTDYII